MPHMGLNIRIFMDGKFVKSKLSITKKVIVFLDVEFATSTSKLHYIDPKVILKEGWAFKHRYRVKC